MKLLLIIPTLITFLSSIVRIDILHGGSKSLCIYVSPNGSDQDSGKKERPLSSLVYALEKSQQFLVGKKKAEVQIFLEEGKYELDKTLIIDRDYADKENRIYIKGLGGGAILSGGKELDASQWEKVKDAERGVIWKYRLDGKLGAMVVRQLFKNGVRQQRASSEVFRTAGPIDEFSTKIKRFDFTGVKELKKESLKPFCTFRYAEDNLVEFEDFENAEIIVHHSWESSWHKIVKVDKNAKEVYLTNPFGYPIGFFSLYESFSIENTKDYFNKPNTWMFDQGTKEILYYSKKGENPRDQQFIIPVLHEILLVKGSVESPVRNISFSNIKFSFSDYLWGVNEVESAIVKANKGRYPWMDFSVGYSGVQAAPRSGQSILLEFAENIVFDHCDFTNLGSYAIKLGRGSRRNIISNCKIHKTGAGGILVGTDVSNINPDRFPKNEASNNNVIVNNEISNCGIIHPSGVGIAIMQSYQNRVENNKIHNLPYTGISLGWTWNDGLNYTKDNIVSGNEIYEVMQLLADGAGIYTLGRLEGNVVRNNYIHSLSRSDIAVGASLNGIFFDQGTSELEVTENRVENIDGQIIKYNKANKDRIQLLKNSFD